MTVLSGGRGVLAGVEREIIDRIEKTGRITKEELSILLLSSDDKSMDYLAKRAGETTLRHYGNKIYIRGLIEFTNYCRNDCYYCGIRKSNRNAKRYRLSEEEILSAAGLGYRLGFRTFVLQGGEDPWFTDEKICALVSAVKSDHPDCAVTLSIGEKKRDSYQAYFDAGADRYLLRHETADEVHYRKLHPPDLALSNRIRCLSELKEIGYQTGCGFMVGSPGQTMETLFLDLSLIQELSPHMVGIGPFIPHKDTPFCREAPGTLERTLRLLSIIRLIHPKVLLPATTALGTIHPDGRKRGILAGANVVMPNLTPQHVREKYELYNGKASFGEEAAEGLGALSEELKRIGYQIAVDIGDSKVPIVCGRRWPKIAAQK